MQGFCPVKASLTDLILNVNKYVYIDIVPFKLSLHTLMCIVHYIIIYTYFAINDTNDIKRYNADLILVGIINHQHYPLTITGNIGYI